MRINLKSIPFPILQSSCCMSGCSEGHVVHWDMNSGNCVHDLGEYGALSWSVLEVQLLPGTLYL